MYAIWGWFNVCYLCSSSISYKSINVVMYTIPPRGVMTQLYWLNTPGLISLHWLPVKYRIDLKILLFVYKSLSNLAPQHRSDLLQHVLRSADSGLLRRAHSPATSQKQLIVLFLLLTLSCGIVSKFISELPQHYLFLNLLLKLISLAFHIFWLAVQWFFISVNRIHFTVCVLLFINSSTCFCFAYCVQHCGRLR